MGSIRAAAEAIATTISATGVRATADPGRAASIRPCVLVPPPTIDYSEQTNTWRLACLSSKAAGTLAALDELDELVQTLLTIPQLHIERAEPGSYVLATDQPAVPAYIVTITT